MNTLTTTDNRVDTDLCGIGVDGVMGRRISEYLRANRIDVPVIEEPITGRRIFVAAGVRRAARAIESMRNLGAEEGTEIALPLLEGGSTRWAVAPEECRGMPPVVAIAAAMRAVSQKICSVTGDK